MRPSATVVITSPATLLSVGQSQAQIELKPAVALSLTGVSEDPADGESKGQVGWQIGGTVVNGEKLHGEAGVFYAK